MSLSPSRTDHSWGMVRFFSFTKGKLHLFIRLLAPYNLYGETYFNLFGFNSWVCVALALQLGVRGVGVTAGCAWRWRYSWVCVALALQLGVRGVGVTAGCAWRCRYSWVYVALALQLGVRGVGVTAGCTWRWRYSWVCVALPLQLGVRGVGVTAGCAWRWRYSWVCVALALQLGVRGVGVTAGCAWRCRYSWVCVALPLQLGVRGVAVTAGCTWRWRYSWVCVALALQLGVRGVGVAAAVKGVRVKSRVVVTLFNVDIVLAVALVQPPRCPPAGELDGDAGAPWQLLALGLAVRDRHRRACRGTGRVLEVARTVVWPAVVAVVHGPARLAACVAYDI